MIFRSLLQARNAFNHRKSSRGLEVAEQGSASFALSLCSLSSEIFSVRSLMLVR
jgi:hypothetical protein